ncbi:MAG: ATP-binding cassette domain-containing protein [Planctomycetota bacterium]
MIEVENLIKDYGQVRALHGVSFEVPRGQVLGFLGPNGAGKSTTMKILTGYLFPTAGRAVLAGHDVTEEALEVRRKVGYLPESNPLYMDMRVDDYLRFAADVRGVPAKDQKRSLDRVIHDCGLQRVVKKGVIELSKGYKQRVGLAQAMIHEPEILILDEPTSGLDPNQIIEIRDLIRHIGQNRTVILSTHILQEVEASCDRILIITQGRLAADGTAQELCDQLPAGPLEVEVIGPAEAVEQQLRELFTGGRIDLLPAHHARHGGHAFRISVPPHMDEHAREAVYDLVQVNQWKLVHLYRQRANLEAVFRKFTLSAEAADELEHKARGEEVAHA